MTWPPGPALGQVHRVREDAVAVLHLATRLLLGLDPDVQTLDEVPVRDVDVPDLEQAADVDRPDPVAPTEHLRRLPQRPGHAHLPREAVAGSAGQDPDPRRAADRIRGLEDGVRELVLGPVATVADHEVHAIGEGRLRLGGGIAVLLGDADVPVHAVPVEHVVEDVEDRLVLAGRRVDHHVDALIRSIHHRRPPPPTSDRRTAQRAGAARIEQGIVPHPRRAVTCFGRHNKGHPSHIHRLPAARSGRLAIAADPRRRR